jgi:Flp pilus assembly protein CpaB
VAIDEQPAFEPASGPANAPAGYRIDSVPVVLTPSTSQLLPGDRIDLVADMSRACTAPRMLTRTTLWNVQVLEADPQWQRELDGDGIVTGWTGTVSLLVQRDQVEPLLLARSRGRLQVTADRSISAEERVAGYRLPPSLQLTR